jgi:hypothetical protein
MPLDLPAGSLGPKPTKKQLELLVRMAAPGVRVRVWEGMRLQSGGAFLSSSEKPSENVNRATVGKFVDWGWLSLAKPGYPGSDFIVTDRGRKVIKRGETRR